MLQQHSISQTSWFVFPMYFPHTSSNLYTRTVCQTKTCNITDNRIHPTKYILS